MSKAWVGYFKKEVEAFIEAENLRGANDFIFTSVKELQRFGHHGILEEIGSDPFFRDARFQVVMQAI